jgi:hypothetical protein
MAITTDSAQHHSTTLQLFNLICKPSAAASAAIP